MAFAVRSMFFLPGLPSNTALALNTWRDLPIHNPWQNLIGYQISLR